MKAPLQALGILLLSLVAAAITWAIAGPSTAEAAQSCDPATVPKGEICLKSIPKDQAVLWVDARSRKDWERDGLEGSLLWNLDTDEDMDAFERDFFVKVASQPSQSAALQVIIYCYDKQCGTSKQIAKRIRKLDLAVEVHALHGGIEALRDAGQINTP